MRSSPPRRTRMPVFTYLLYLFAATLLLSGVTLSQYVASDFGGDSARVIKIGELTIEESGNGAGGDRWILTPGVDVTKRATVKFDGSEAACYVFLKINAPGWSHTDEQTHHFFYMPSGSSAELLAWDVTSSPDGWTYLRQDGDDCIFYTVLAPNTSLSREIVANGGKITVNPAIRRSQLTALPQNLTFTAIAVQYDGFGNDLPADHTAADHAVAAWNAVGGK